MGLDGERWEKIQKDTKRYRKIVKDTKRYGKVSQFALNSGCEL